MVSSLDKLQSRDWQLFVKNTQSVLKNGVISMHHNHVSVHVSDLFDMPGWLLLAREVEPLFGPMTEKTEFFEEMSKAILAGNAFCIRDDSNRENCGLCGGIVISRETNSIAWFVVDSRYRNMGLGKKLLKEALRSLNQSAAITVNTFDSSAPEGDPARKVYLSFGFVETSQGPVNPAGFGTVVMSKPALLTF